MSALIHYVLKTAQKNVKLKSIEEYRNARYKIYNRMLLNNLNKVDTFFPEAIREIPQQYETVKKALNNIIKNIENDSNRKNQNSVFINNSLGNNNERAIQNLISQAKELREINDIDKFNQQFLKMEKATEFIQKEIREKSFKDKTIFSIATNDYNKLKETVQNNKNIIDIQQQAKFAYPALIGNIGESMGIVKAYDILSTEINLLRNHNIEVNIENTGDRVVKGKRAVGDTQIQFLYNGNIIFNISMSNKLSANYGKSKSHSIKIRETFVGQINFDSNSAKKLMYNALSLHADENNKTIELFTSKQLIPFRRYIASLIMQQNLYGAFTGDNVYFFNYGEYVYTIKDLLTYWTSDTTTEGGIPMITWPSVSKRLSVLTGVTSQKHAEELLSKLPINVMFNLHSEQMSKALNLTK